MREANFFLRKWRHSARWTLLAVAGLTSCAAPRSYLEVHQPWDVIFQKRSYGGAADLIGTELHAPAFTLYANGSVIAYNYRDNKRRLLVKRLDRDEFLNLYHRISILMLFDNRDSAYVVESFRDWTDAPTTEMMFYSKRLVIKGLGMYKKSPTIDSLQAFITGLDRREWPGAKAYQADSVRVFVKKLKGGDPQVWPVWPIGEIRLESLYHVERSAYEPNVEDNSRVYAGDLARQVQAAVDQVSMYQKFSWGSAIYSVGYRPLIP